MRVKGKNYKAIVLKSVGTKHMVMATALGRKNKTYGFEWNSLKIV
jgi:hypothetical protein